uniref:DUF4218 domain-containing protein n=1 Tax=Photinus pyralis TaxID=7054 RepID=A0A1Y1KCD2_PHOPY
MPKYKLPQKWYRQAHRRSNVIIDTFSDNSKPDQYLETNCPPITDHDDDYDLGKGFDSEIIDNISDIDDISNVDSNEGSCSQGNSTPTFENKFDTEPTTQCFQVLLAMWAVKFQICHNSLNALLHLLQKFDSNLPLDSRTLLKTPKKCELKVIDPGKYYHFGIYTAVSKLLNKLYPSNQFDSIKINVNIDGLPLSKSSSSQLYPILCNLENYPSEVEIIGLYHGFDKPSDANMLLNDFINEAVSLSANGFSYKDYVYPFSINSFICDAPAKSFVTFTKGHTGYNSCSKCHIEGEYTNNRIHFSETNALRNRTDCEFRSKLDDDHHSGTSLIESVPSFDMVKDIVLDYMHLICLGVVRKLFLLWVDGKPKTKLPFCDISNISNSLIRLAKSVPCEFVRKPRSLSELKRFKATEFRQFLYYTGPIVLKSILSPDRYMNFLSLHVSVTILSNEKYLQEFGSYAHSLLKYFIETFIVLYGEEYVSHNVHNLLHLYEDCQRFGILQKFSAFPFENYLQSLKSLLRKGNNPLPQIVNRILENNNVQEQPPASVKSPLPQHKHFNGPMLGNFYRNQYKCVHFSDFVLKLSPGDNCCGLKDKSIISIENFVTNSNDDLFIIGRKFNTCKDFYLQPCPSSTLGIYVVDDLGPLGSWNVEEISCKFFKMNYNDKFVVVPLLHSIN